MIGKYKWLVIPPAAAVILFLGPLRQGAVTPPPKGGETETAATEADPAGDRPTEAREQTGKPGVLAMPDLWQVTSALIGVLLLGGVGIVLLGRMRNGAGGAGALVTLRQSLRLSSRQHLHAVEFDGNLLLLGEVEGKLTVLHTGAPPERIEEEAAVAETAEEGAVPRNLLIPRPQRQPGGARRPPRTAAERKAAAELSDFRSLLRKVRAGQQA